MTEQMPINQIAAEQRLIEGLTGSTVPSKVPEKGEPVEPGDPEPLMDKQRPS